MSEQTKRLTVAADIQRTAFKEEPCIPTGQWFNPSAWRNNISGIMGSASPVFLEFEEGVRWPVLQLGNA